MDQGLTQTQGNCRLGSHTRFFSQLQLPSACNLANRPLKMVQSDFSFRSAHNMVEMLRLLDKESKIFPRMTLGRQKCGYYMTHALYPFYLEALIKRILEAPAYTLGVDGGSFKVRGLKKMIDIVIRWLYLFQYSLIAYPGTTTSQGGRLLMSSWTHMRLVMSQPTSK